MKDIDVAKLKNLREQGWSWQRLANHFGISRATAKRRYKGGRKNTKNQDVMEFAKKLQKLALEAPPGLCRRELMRSVNFIRTRAALTEEQKKQLVLSSLGSGAEVVEHIAEDCQFTRKETVEILEKLLEEKQVEKRERGGKLNSGRKMKFQWLLPSFA